MRLTSFLPLAAALLLVHIGFSQHLVSSTFKGARTQAQLINDLGIPFIQYGVRFYRVTYQSFDAKGVPDTLSGLLVVPDNNTLAFPRVVYQHGTSSCKTCVPGNYGGSGGDEGSVGLGFAGMGFIALLPDYVGMGSGRGFQAYVHAATEASAAADMLRASGEWLTQNGFYANDQLFITGYSQGGHASMALHRAVETDLAGEMTVTAAAHCSGPYSVSGVMRDLILSDQVYFYPAYIPNTALSYQEVYGTVYSNLTDLFRPEYATAIQEYYNGTRTLTSLNTFLIQKLIQLNGASRPRMMLQDAALVAIETDPDHPINVAMRDNDLFRWAPIAPTRIFYCMGDDQVPFMNSVIARDTMLSLGATDLSALDLNPNFDHGECAEPALTSALLFFVGYQQISVANQSPAKPTLLLETAPNPATDVLRVTGAPVGATIRLIDPNGKVVLEQIASDFGALGLNIKGLPTGIYTLSVVDSDGRFGIKRVAVMR